MERFIDRESELETLQSEYARNGSALVVLYGRRRVGKTTLISEFIKDKNALFFLASEESETQNRHAFKENAAEFMNSDLLRNADVKSWDVIFKALMDTTFASKPGGTVGHLPGRLARGHKKDVACAEGPRAILQARFSPLSESARPVSSSSSKPPW